RCANAVVKARHDTGLLSSACRGTARRRAAQSTCGRPGAAVCCRISGTRVRGRIVRAPGLCQSPATAAAGVAVPSDVGDGWLSTRCSLCGNGVRDPGEDFDLPGAASVTRCRYARCGDGVVEAWEQCEPTGAPGCTDDCMIGTCDAPPPGEIPVACV